MLDRLKKNSVKILVFAVNILLAAIAVLVIREKDQDRLLGKAGKENPASSGAAGENLPSFKQSIESTQAGSLLEGDTATVPENGMQTVTDADPGNSVATPPDISNSATQNTLNSAPTPMKTAPSVVPDRKTKTS